MRNLNDQAERLVAECLRALTRLGLTPDWTREAAGDRRPDGVLRLRPGGRVLTFAVEVQRTIRPTMATVLRERLGPGGLVLTETLTPGTAEALRSVDLNAVDASGNTSIRADGLYLEISGRRRSAAVGRRPSSPTPFSRAGMPVLFALLVSPDLAHRSVREIQRLVPVSVGTVHSVLTWLREAGHLTAADGIRRPEVLEERWIDTYLASFRPGLEVTTFDSSHQLIGNWVRDAVGEDAVVAGESARYLAGASIRPAAASFFIWGEPESVIRAGRLRRDPAGPVEVRHAFFSKELPSPGPGLAPELLTRAELHAVGDPRVVALLGE